MRPIQHPVRLTTEEREQLRAFNSKSKAAVRSIRRDWSKETTHAARSYQNMISYSLSA
ncbi:hypothetical protein [Paenibacillus monticola]|uniref:Uncharacterized protein n=1 Tax=Paenibacillus monticola TaxID=2666075 RepID=A0A7X2H381_9BACL|nr:hypothetical protein [Paenibacillus monticola]MRN52741.1 hypothetical protein [Paenibacillus monticola]